MSNERLQVAGSDANGGSAPIVIAVAGVLIFCLLVIGPLLGTIWLSLTEYNVLQPPTFVGLENYLHLLTQDDLLGMALLYTCGIVLVRVAAALLVWQLLIGAWCRGRTISNWLVVIAVAPLPFLNSVGSPLLWKLLADPDGGLLGGIVSWQSPNGARAFLLSIEWLHALALYTAFGVLIYALAQKVGHKPNTSILRVTRTIVVIFAVASGLQTFDLSYVVTNGGPSNSTTTLAQAGYRQSFEYFRMGYGATHAAVTLFVVIILAIVLVRQLQRSNLRIEPRELIARHYIQGPGSAVLFVLALLPTLIILGPYLLLGITTFGETTAASSLGTLFSEDGLLPEYGLGWIERSILPLMIGIWIIQLPLSVIIASALWTRWLAKLPRFTGFFFVLCAIAALSTSTLTAVPVFLISHRLGTIGTPWPMALSVVNMGIPLLLCLLILRGITIKDMTARELVPNAAFPNTSLSYDEWEETMPMLLFVGLLATCWLAQSLYMPLLTLNSPETFTAGLRLLFIMSMPSGSNMFQYADLVRVIQFFVLPIAIPGALLLSAATIFLLNRLRLVAD